MKSYEELLSDIEEDMELMGSSHIVYSMEEDGVVTDYDYLPSDSCTISITLKELQEKLQLQMLYTKVSAHTAGADKKCPEISCCFSGHRIHCRQAASVLYQPPCQQTRLQNPHCILWHPPGKCQRRS
mgnify:CR=1 FL=1